MNQRQLSLGDLASVTHKSASAWGPSASTHSSTVGFQEVKEGLEILRRDAEQGAEWIKSAAVSAEQAQRSMDRLDSLERSRPTLGQVARYGSIGGLGGAAIGAVGNAIEHGSALKGATPKAKMLNLAANTVKGALGGGALPLLRASSDRNAEMGTLRKFMSQDKVAADESQEGKKPRLALGAAALAAPVAAASTAAEAAPRLVGSELLYHGTGPSAASSIGQHGLDPARGGSGAASWEHADPEFRANSEGHVHVTKSRSNAEMYSRLGGAREAGDKLQEMDLLTSKGQGKGRVLPISLPFDRVKSDFHLDPNGDMLNDLRSTKSIPAGAVGSTDESYLKSVWRGRPSNYLSYVKNNPKRVATGLALGAATPALLYGGYRAGKALLPSKHSDKTAAFGSDKVAAPWLHARAEHILAKNPSMGKGEAFAIATQQSHATGHTPKGYGTPEGKATAKAKYDTPKDDEQTANPGKLNSPKLAALGAAPLWRQQAGFTPPGMLTAAQRLKKSMNMGTVNTEKGLHPLNIKVGSTIVSIVKQAGLVSNMVQRVPQAIHAAPTMAKNLMTAPNEHFGHLNEVAGLGVLALPGLDTLQSKVRARLAGDKSEHGAEKRQLMGEGAHAALDVGGLGMLAAPALAKLKHAFAASAYGGNPAQNGPGAKSHSPLPPFQVPSLQVKMSGPLKRVGELVTGSKASRIRDAAARHTGKSARKLRGMAKAEESKVGRTQGALVGAAALGAASDAMGLHDRIKEGGVGVGAGMTTSQYSGPLSYGPFKMTSGIPPFRRQAMTKNDDSLEGAAWQTGGNKEAAALLEGFEAGLKEASGAATGAMGAAGKLSTSQRVGAPKVTGFAGPSIADVAKPKGFGMPMPGAQKNQL